MNDWWNDPPEESFDFAQDKPEHDDSDPSTLNYDTLQEYKMDITEDYIRPEAEKCPHGKEWGSCYHCDFLSDIAYDAWREKR